MVVHVVEVTTPILLPTLTLRLWNHLFANNNQLPYTPLGQIVITRYWCCHLVGTGDNTK